MAQSSGCLLFIAGVLMTQSSGYLLFVAGVFVPRGLIADVSRCTSCADGREVAALKCVYAATRRSTRCPVAAPPLTLENIIHLFAFDYNLPWCKHSVDDWHQGPHVLRLPVASNVEKNKGRKRRGSLLGSIVATVERKHSIPCPIKDVHLHESRVCRICSPASVEMPNHERSGKHSKVRRGESHANDWPDRAKIPKEQRAAGASWSCN